MSSIAMAPYPKDATDFSFLQMRPIQLPTADQVEDQVIKKSTQLLAVGNKLGLLFAGFRNGLAIVEVNQIEQLDSLSDRQKEVKKVPANIERGELPGAFHLGLPASPTHLALNNDELVLAVCINLKGLPHIYLYDTRAFVAFRNDLHKIKPFLQIPPSTPSGTVVQDLQWNPVTANLLAVVYSNGSLALYGIAPDSQAPDCWTLPPAEGIACINWSPKGKQLVAGRLNGSLTQYKPDLKEAKTIAGPEGKKLSAISILWVSTYQFVVAYKDNLDASSRPGIYVVQGSKAGPTTFTFYDDICFSTGDDRTPNFYSIPVPDWGIICIASANSIEVGLLGAADKEQSSWVQLIPPDFGRAEIPLKAEDQSERYPVGVALCTSTQRQLQFGEKVLSFSMPTLFMLTGDGLLSGFYAVNQDCAATQVTKPAEPITSATGMRQGTIELPKPVHQQQQHQQQPAAVKPFESPQPAMPFEPAQTSKAGFGFGGQTPFASSTPAKPAAKPFQPITPGFGSGSVPVSTGSISKPTPPPPAFKAPASVPSTAITKPKPEKAKEPTLNSSTEATFGKAILEEIQMFGSELQKFKQKSATLNINIGSQSEKGELKQTIEGMERFCKDLVEITSSQAKEINGLQKTNLELFAWVEEAKSRDIRSKNPRYRQLLKNRSLDPANQKKMTTLESKFKYLDQQLQQVNEMLDMEWEQHLNKTKAKGISGSPASKEMVYKAILSNRNILESEKNALAKITKEIKALKLKSSPNKTSEMERQLSQSLTQMTKMTESFYEKTKISESPRKNESAQFTSPAKNVATASFSSSSSQRSPSMNAFSPEKQTALRSFLMAKGTTKVKPVKPVSISESQFLKMVSPSKPDSTPDSKSKHLIEQLRKKEQLCEPVKKVDKAAAFSALSSSVSSSKSSSSGSLSSSGLGLAAAATARTAESGFSARIQEHSKPAIETVSGSFHKSSSFAGGLITSTTGSGSSAMSSSASGTAFSGPAFGSSSSTLPKPNFAFGSPSPAPGQQSSVYKPAASKEPTPTKEVAIKTESVFVSKPSEVRAKTPEPNKIAPPSTPFGASSTFGTQAKGPPFGSDGKVATSLFGAGTAAASSTFFGSGDQKESSTFVTPSTKAPSSGTTTAATIEPVKKLDGVATQATPKPLFASVTSAPSSSTPASSSIFGGASTITPSSTSASTPSVFGAKTATTTTAAPATTTIFGGGASSGGAVFASAPAATTSSSIFGTKTSVSSTGSSIFGATAEKALSIFGGSGEKASTTKTASVFGGASAATPPGAGSMFGDPGTSGGSVFGGIITAPATSTPSTGTIFGGSGTATPAPPGGSSLFGTGGAAFGAPINMSSTSSIFGTPASTTTTSASVFGTTTASAATVGSSTPSVFGAPTASASTAGTSTSSVFGTPTASASTPLFGSRSIFAAAAAGSSGTDVASDSVFGGSKSVFGQTTTATGFGSSTPVPSSGSIFGGAVTPSSSGGIFGGSTPSSGGFFSGLGSTPSTEAANKNPFGVSSFGQASSSAAASLFGGQQQQSVFGGSAAKSGSIFGGSATTTPSGGGLFSGASGSVISQGFGAAQTTPVKSGFGAQPAFGGAPAFGSPPAFGAAASPVFGGAPALGAGAVPSAFGANVSVPSNVFGSAVASDAPTFGSMGGGGSTFGNVTQQGTPSTFGGFGQQQQQQPPAQTFSGFGSPGPAPTNAAFSSWR